MKWGKMEGNNSRVEVSESPIIIKRVTQKYPKVQRVILSYFVVISPVFCKSTKKDSYSFEIHWNSYCLFGKYLLSLY